MKAALHQANLDKSNPLETPTPPAPPGAIQEKGAYQALELTQHPDPCLLGINNLGDSLTPIKKLLKGDLSPGFKSGESRLWAFGRSVDWNAGGNPLPTEGITLLPTPLQELANQLELPPAATSFILAEGPFLPHTLQIFQHMQGMVAFPINSRANQSSEFSFKRGGEGFTVNLNGGDRALFLPGPSSGNEFFGENKAKALILFAFLWADCATLQPPP